MGSFLEKPKVEKTTDNGSGNGLEYALCSMQGWRLEMEDAHTCTLQLPDMDKWSFFAVFDGHAGAKVAEESSGMLVQSLLDQPYFKDSLTPNPDICNKCTYDCDKIKESIHKSFLELDEKLKIKEYSSGTTVVCLLITPKHLFYINCGDSRAVHVKTADQDSKVVKHPAYQTAIDNGHFGEEPRIAKLNSQGKNQTDEEAKEDTTDNSPKQVKEPDSTKNGYGVYFSTRDHKPVDQEERERIEAAGGMVLIQRINGALAVSRALGDFDYKRNEDVSAERQLVSPVPEVTVIERSTADSASKDAYAIIACDGIYDAITNDNLQIFTTYKLKAGLAPQAVSASILDLCLNLGSRDNMSIILLTFDECPKENAEIKSLEAENDAKLKELILKQMGNGKLYDGLGNKPFDLDQVSDTLFQSLTNDKHFESIYGEYLFQGSYSSKFPLVKECLAQIHAQQSRT